ncbi:uncharacterized protein [Leptinotarsa decemlineata]|uniref:uncharacterized protein n=1 Tax=Leptinotarsa decemlineata TaxID=7539 RepID=UPI003D3083A1
MNIFLFSDIKKRRRASEDQDPKISSTSEPFRQMMISPGDNKMIKLDKLTEKQENLLLNKIIMQMERNKLIMAKRKEKAGSFHISLQPIHDGEFIISHEDESHIDKAHENSEPDLKPEPNKLKRIAGESLIPFNDNDEMYVGPMPPRGDLMSSPPVFLGGSRDMRRFPGPSNWIGGPRGRRFWENPPRMTVRNQPAKWMNLPPYQHHRKCFRQQFQHPIEFSLTPGEKFPLSSDIEPKDHLSSGAVNIYNEYGGLPKPVVINGKQHSIRFPVLPKGIKPGRANIRDIEGKGSISPKFNEKSQESNTDAHDPALPVMSEITISKEAESPARNSNSSNLYRNLLQKQSMDEWSSQHSMAPTLAPIPETGAHQVANQSNLDVPTSGTTTSEPTSIMNVNDLFQKLVAFGFVTSTGQKNPPVSQDLMGENPPISGPTVSKLKRNTCDNLRPITFEQLKTLQVRQNVLYSTLYSGMQCSSCGMRFSPEASMKYSQHLDWHFRQNRRGKRNCRVANSRRWYYSLSDWKNYEELEDLKEREKSYFDQQQQHAGDVGEEAEDDVIIPSVSADPESTDECCDVCRDKFDYFFNEEKEEWHLKNAIRVEDKTYHPLCYEDCQQSLLDETADESRIQSPESAKQEETTIPGLEIVLDVDDEDEDNNEVDTEPAGVVSAESDESKQVEDENDKTEQPLGEGGDDDNDDVILNEVAPIVIVVDDDAEIRLDSTVSEMNDNSKVNGDSIDDGFVEISCLVSLKNGKQMKIKAEPVDLEASPEEEPEEQPEEHLREIPLSQTELLSTMDGNMELLSNTSSVPTSGISYNKIKITISKPLPVINQEKKSVGVIKTPSEICKDPLEPFTPEEELEPAALKPPLKNIRLTKLPPVRKGHELTGLCSIM